MNKQCEIKEYIKVLPITEKHKEYINDKHNEIFDYAKSTKKFVEKKPGILVAYKHRADKATEDIVNINNKFGAKVVALKSGVLGQTLQINAISASTDFNDIRNDAYYNYDIQLKEQEEAGLDYGEGTLFQLPDSKVKAEAIKDLDDYVLHNPIDRSLSSNKNMLYYQIADKTTKDIIKIKPGVPELFESNESLANSVYEALGFNNTIKPTDKIIWGHPAIGKTTAKEQKGFLDFDTDFKPLVAQKLGLPKSQQNSLGLNEWRKATGNEEAFNSAMREVWTLAKEQSKAQNKILMVSDMIFLRENQSDFDKIINVPANVFINRATQRGDALDNLQSWKNKIDQTLKNIDNKKIITTDKYLSDLFITPQQKQQAQQLYSSYLDTIFPDSKAKEMDSSLYISVLNQLEQENKIEKDCSGGKLKAKDGIATLFEQGGKWEIVTDFKNAPTHKSGGKNISIQDKKVEVEKNELKIENDFGDVAVIPSKYRIEVQDAIKSNCHSCIDGIVESLPKMKDYAGDGTVFPFFGRYKRFKNSLPDNLKNTPEDEYAMRYYWKHSNKPKSFDEAINREQPMFTIEDDGYYHAPSVEPNTLRFLKPKTHPTLQYELDWYNSDNPEAVDFRNKYDLDTSDKFYKYVPKKK